MAENTEAEPLENPNPMGRPSEYSQEVADAICDLMAEGKGLREICSREGMPGRTSVLRWLRDNADFRSQYARARIHLMDWYAEEIVRISADESGDVIIDQDGDKSRTVANHAKVQRDRLKVDTLKWIMSRLAPKRYGNNPEDLLPADEHPVNGNELADLMKAIDGRTRSVDSVSVRWENIERTIVTPGEKKPDEPETPRMITYQPVPPPADLTEDEWAKVNRVLAMIPDESDASADEVFSVVEDALRKHFGMSVTTAETVA